MRFVFGLRGRRLAVLSTAMLALSGGVAYATAAILTTGTATSVIQACLLKGVGTIRIVSDASKCSDKFETPISWNVVGPQGLPGKDGANGKDGLNGAPGAKGNTGAAGTNGTNGTNGLPGATGAPGKDGINGTNGADGQPCLPSNPLCVGPKGDKGDKGDPGAQGPTGPQGPSGSGGGLASLDSLDGTACNAAGTPGTITVTYGAPPAGAVTLACRPTATLTLTVIKAGAGSGTVTSDIGSIACGATCSDSFAVDSVVNLTPTASGTDVFTGWSGACSGTGGCAVTMDAAKTVIANFSPTAALTVVQSGGFCFQLGVDENGNPAGCADATSGPIEELFNADASVFNCDYSWVNAASSSTCVHRFAVGTVVTVSPQDVHVSGSGGYPVWGGACTSTSPGSDCAVTMNFDKNGNADKFVTATYPNQ